MSPTALHPSKRKPEISFREFIPLAWQVVEPGTVFVPNWHIDAIAEHLEAATRGDIRQLIINIPPRHMKSLLVSVMWPAWVWTFWPESRWLTASYALSLAIRDTVKARRIIRSDWYQEHWGHVFAMSGDQNVKSRYENTRTGYRIATSVDSAVTGEGGDFIGVDDPHNVKQVTSETTRESAEEWWDQSMTTRQNDAKVGAKVVVMQRVHESDLTGHLLKKGDWEHLMIPAEFESKRKCVTGIGWADPRKQEGELLWPARVDAVQIGKLKRDLGSYGSAGQLQQRPAPAEGGIFKRHWWQFYESLPYEFDDLILSVDCAFKDTKHSAYVVLQVWLRNGANKYLLDQTRDKLDFTGTIAAIRTICAKWPQIRAKLIEDKANGPAVINSLRNSIAGIVPVEPDGSKEARAHAVSPQVEAGNVYLPIPDRAPWVDDFINECAEFPNSTYADQVDSMTQALSRLEFGENTFQIEYDSPVRISPV